MIGKLQTDSISVGWDTQEGGGWVVGWDEGEGDDLQSLSEPLDARDEDNPAAAHAEAVAYLSHYYGRPVAADDVRIITRDYPPR